MTGQHRKPELREGGPVPGPGTFLVRPVDADRVREAISGVVADAINRAAETLTKIREWCDEEATACRDQIASGTCVSGTDTYCAECVEISKARLKAIEEVRDLLPALPEAAEEVDVDGTRVTRDDREYPGDDNHWRSRGGTDSGN